MKFLPSILTASLTLVCAADEWTLAKRTTADSGELPPVPAWSCGETDTNHIDLLIVLDASAKPFMDGENQSPEEYAAGCVSDLNVSLGYTGVSEHFTFRLAGVLDLSPVSLDDYELSDILAGFTPILTASKPLEREIADRIRVKREECRADIVAILAAGKNPIKYGESAPLTIDDLTSGELDAKANQAYCVCKLDSLAKRHVLLHEIGHLMGAGHSDAQHVAPGPQLFPFSAAYRFHAGETPLTTVTGYPEIKDGIILPFYSSPDYAITYTCSDGSVWRDIPVGTPSNDNSRTVIALHQVTAQHRAAKPSDALLGFDKANELSLTENGVAVAGHEDTITLRCGVNREFVLNRTGNNDTSVAVARLPPGLSFGEEKGVLEGKATKPGRYVTFFTFTDSQTNLKSRRWMKFDVTGLPDWAVGAFVAENGRRRIKVSDKGSVTVSSQQGYKVVKKSFSCFVREEKDAEGNPVFFCEDGTKVLCEGNGENGNQGIAVTPDNVRYLPETKRKTGTRQRTNNKAKKQLNRKEKQQ